MYVLNIFYRYCVFFLFFISVGIKAKNFEIALAELITKTSSFKPKKTHFSSLAQMEEALANEPTITRRLERNQHWLNTLSQYQFAEGLWIRELVSNALDSYANDDEENTADLSRVVSLATNSDEGSLIIRDEGVGMGLDEIIFYLLTPGRSKNRLLLDPENGKKDNIGQFGIGFFSCLSMLKTSDDTIIVSTNKNQGLRYEMTLKKREGKIWLSINETNEKGALGTSMKIISASLKHEVSVHTHKIVGKYFSFNQKALIKIDEQVINDPALYSKHRFIFEHHAKKSFLSYYLSKMQGSPSTTQLLSKGVSIEEFTFKSYNAAGMLAVELPSIKLTSDRSAIDRECQKTQQALKSLANQAISNEQYQVFNAIYPLLSHSFFGQGLKFELQLRSHFIPAHQASSNINKILLRGNLIKARAIHPEAFPHYRYLPRINPTGPVGIFAGTFKLSGQWAVYLEDCGIFIDATLLAPFSHITKLLINGLWKLEQNKIGISHVSPIFSKDVKAAVSDKISIIEPPITVANAIEKSVKGFTGYISYYKKLYKFSSTIAKLITPSVLKINNEDHDKSATTVLGELFFQIETNCRNFDYILAYLEQLKNDDELLKISAINLQHNLALLKIPFDCLKPREAWFVLMRAFDPLTLEEKLSESTPLFIDRYRNFLNNILNLGKDKKNEEKRDRFERKITSFLRFHITSSDKLDYFEAMIKRARNFGIKKPEVWAIDTYDEWSVIFPDLPSMMNQARLNEYFNYRVAAGKKNHITSNWTEFLQKMITAPKKPMATIPISLLSDLHAFSEFFSLRSLSDSVDETIKINCRNILLEMFDRLLIDEQLAKELHLFVLNIDAIHDVVWQSIKSNRFRITLDMLFGHLSRFSSIDIATWIYRILFADSTTFFAKNVPFVGDRANLSLAPIYENPKVEEILGLNEDVVAQQYLIVAHQNLLLKHSWMNELIKNAHDAHATEISFFVTTDEHGQLMVEVQDNGDGIKAHEMYKLFVPGLTSKKEREDDINFGCGFFSVFSCFDDAFVASYSLNDLGSPQILLTKNKETSRFFLAEQIKACDTCSPGTTISLRRKMLSSYADPVEIKANLLRYADTYKNLIIFFNGEKLPGLNIHLADESEALATLTLSENQRVYIVPSFQSGIYYNGLMLSPSITKYTSLLLDTTAQALKQLPHTFALHFVGEFKQNIGRNGFIEEAQWGWQLDSLFEKAALTAIAQAGAQNPKILEGLLPYDFYYHFSNRKMPPLVRMPIDKESDDSLISLRSEIENHLKRVGVLSPNRDYNDKAQITKGELEKAFPSKSQQLVHHFEEQITKKLEKIIWEKRSITSSIFDDVALKHLTLPIGYKVSKDTLLLFQNLCTDLAKEFLQKEIRITYYYKPNYSNAHTVQGQTGIPAIGFNLSGTLLQSFDTTRHDAASWPNTLKEIVMTLTHEIVHTEETRRESSHDRQFFDRQIKLLQPFFRLRDEQVEALRVSLTGEVLQP